MKPYPLEPPKPEMIRDGSWPLKAYKNLAFLQSDAARQIRILCELTEPAERLRQAGVTNTIVFFGSARIPDTVTARQNLAQAQAAVEAAPDDHGARARLAAAQRLHRAAPYHDAARDLAQELAAWSQTLPPHQRFHICTGGGPGIMEAVNHGAHLAGAPSIGFGISLPMEPGLNPYVTPELEFEFHYFMIRKWWFTYLAKALVICPGGFGTMDEFFELLTLIQTRKTEHYVPIVLLGRDFWQSVLNLPAFLDWGVISPEDLDLFHLCDTVQEAKDWLISELTTHYLTTPPPALQPPPI